MKKVFFSALLLGFAVASFAGSTKTETKSGAILYWYKVSYDNPAYLNGYVKATEPLVAHDEQSNFDSPCDEGTSRDCIRGFMSPVTSETDAPGTEQVKTDEE
ncbi:hypothetical protein [Pedobacter borealis]|uniref:hypothetical protein n=1 Tax=Pedobacter borealis TaxID=475254 RepID=UPI000493AF35|nr:hypothetical protein [Pedobacter borealis]